MTRHRRIGMYSSPVDQFVVVVVLQHKIGWYWDILCVEGKSEGRFSKLRGQSAAVPPVAVGWKLVAKEVASKWLN